MQWNKSIYILVVYSTLGYKGAVETLYEEKLIEVGREAQHVEGDVSIFFPVETVLIDTNVDIKLYHLLDHKLLHVTFTFFLIYGCCFIIFRSI